MNTTNNSEELVWIESTGGPLILVEAPLVSDWGGHESGSVIGVTDYERACRVTGYIGRVDVGIGQAIVLGDQPYATTWWCPNDHDTGLLVRWGCADGEEEVLEALANLPKDGWEKANVDVDIAYETLLLFDSAFPGYDVGASIPIHLSRGHYRLETLDFEPNERTELIVHRFFAA